MVARLGIATPDLKAHALSLKQSVHPLYIICLVDFVVEVVFMR